MARMSILVVLIAGVLAIGFEAPAPAFALDTIEPFETGVSNAEYHLGYGGVGLAPPDRKISNEFVLGLGMHPRLSGYVASCVSVDAATFRGETDLCFGVLGTAVDTDHFDLDLMLDAGAFGQDLGTLNFGPSVEINLDRDAQMSSWGLYLRSGIAAYGSEVEGQARRVDWSLNPGAYLRLTPRFEMLVEYDTSRGVGAGRADPGPYGLAVGLNSLVHPAIELVTQVRREAGPEVGRPTWSFGLGIIGTLPGGD